MVLIDHSDVVNILSNRKSEYNFWSIFNGEFFCRLVFFPQNISTTLYITKSNLLLYLIISHFKRNESLEGRSVLDYLFLLFYSVLFCFFVNNIKNIETRLAAKRGFYFSSLLLFISFVIDFVHFYIINLLKSVFVSVFRRCNCNLNSLDRFVVCLYLYVVCVFFFLFICCCCICHYFFVLKSDYQFSVVFQRVMTIDQQLFCEIQSDSILLNSVFVNIFDVFNLSHCKWFIISNLFCVFCILAIHLVVSISIEKNVC